MTVYWVVWDAAAHWVVDRLERRGVLPAVSRMREYGALGAARPPSPNCQTPPSLATLWTGSSPDEHGVTGFTVPGAGAAGLSGHASGFSPGLPRVPPVWRSLAEHGRRSAFVHVPWVFDAQGRTDTSVDGAIEAYSSRRERHGVFAVDPAVPAEGRIARHRIRFERVPQGVRVATAAEDRVLTPGGAWSPVLLAPPSDGGAPGTWMACVRAHGRTLLVHTGVWEPRVSGTNPSLCAALRSLPPFAGEGVGPLYRSGTFGPRLAEGGDGAAEAVFLSSVECVAHSFGAAAEEVLRHHDADLAVVYLPMCDDVGHELLGWCDPLSSAYRADIAETVWQHLARCYGWADTVLGRVLDRAGEGDTVVLSADHGMVGSTHLVHLNDPLVRAGLARATADGELDGEPSRVFYHPANNGSLWANPAVTGEEGAGGALRDAMAVLSEVRDPRTGVPVVSGFLDRRGAPLGDGDAPSPPVFVCLAGDYQPSSVLVGADPVVRPTPKTGAHVVNTGAPRLNAVVAALGPAFAPGTDLGVVDNTLPAAFVEQQLAARSAARASAHGNEG